MMAASQYKIRNVHSVILIKYGEARDVKTLGFAQVENIDGPQVFGNLDLEEGIKILEAEIQKRNVSNKDVWIKGEIGNFPEIPLKMGVEELFKKVNHVKSYCEQTVVKR